MGQASSQVLPSLVCSRGEMIAPLDGRNHCEHDHRDTLMAYAVVPLLRLPPTTHTTRASRQSFEQELTWNKSLLCLNWGCHPQLRAKWHLGKVPMAPQASLDLLRNPDWTDAEVYTQVTTGHYSFGTATGATPVPPSSSTGPTTLLPAGSSSATLTPSTESGPALSPNFIRDLIHGRLDKHDTRVLPKADVDNNDDHSVPDSGRQAVLPKAALRYVNDD
eukprot:g64768.t1